MKQRFAIQSLVATVILNAILLGAIYALVGDAIAAANLTLPFFLIGAAITLALWGIIFYFGSGLVEQSVPVSVSTRPAVAEAAAPTAARPSVAPPPVQPKPAPAGPSAEAGAVQMLAILQRQGRLVDFLQEDLSAYDDAQIGAAVRSIHEGCRQALAEHVKLEPIFDESEGSSVTVPAGFDRYAVRLSGDVVGEPPFRGALRHRGWRVASIDVPKQMAGDSTEKIVAAAEVEVNG